MATIPKRMPLEQQQAIYRWLKAVNPWLPPEENVAADYMTLNHSEYEMTTLELKLYIQIPTEPIPRVLEP